MRDQNFFQFFFAVSVISSYKEIYQLVSKIFLMRREGQKTRNEFR